MSESNLTPKIIFTRHAIQRCKEFNIPLKKAVWMAHHSVIEKDHRSLPDKYKKYPIKDDGAYYREGSVLFYILHTKDEQTGEPMDLVLTVFDQKASPHARL